MWRTRLSAEERGDQPTKEIIDGFGRHNLGIPTGIGLHLGEIVWLCLGTVSLVRFLNLGYRPETETYWAFEHITV